jgi:hypothetical protein
MIRYKGIKKWDIAISWWNNMRSISVDAQVRVT